MSIFTVKPAGKYCPQFTLKTVKTIVLSENDSGSAAASGLINSFYSLVDGGAKKTRNLRENRRKQNATKEA